MKGYKVFTQCKYGFEGNEVFYTTSYNLAIQKFNDLLRKTIKENNVVGKDDFRDIVASVKDDASFYKQDAGIVCRKCPFIMIQRENNLVAMVYFWERTSYEYQEYDIECEEVKLEEIEILEG